MNFLTGFSSRNISQGPRCMRLHFQSEGPPYIAIAPESTLCGAEGFFLYWYFPFQLLCDQSAGIWRSFRMSRWGSQKLWFSFAQAHQIHHMQVTGHFWTCSGQLVILSWKKSPCCPLNWLCFWLFPSLLLLSAMDPDPEKEGLCDLACGPGKSDHHVPLTCGRPNLREKVEVMEQDVYKKGPNLSQRIGWNYHSLENFKFWSIRWRVWFHLHLDFSYTVELY